MATKTEHICDMCGGVEVYKPGTYPKIESYSVLFDRSGASVATHSWMVKGSADLCQGCVETVRTRLAKIFVL